MSGRDRLMLAVTRARSSICSIGRVARARGLGGFTTSWLLLALIVFPFEAVAGGYRPFFVKDAPKNAVLGQMANVPQAANHGRYTFVAYQGPSLDPYVAAWDHETDLWIGPYRAGINPEMRDSHGAPAMYVDGDGYIHVFYGAHHKPLRHARSKDTLSIDSWIDMPTIGAQVTYPQALQNSSHETFLFYRERAHSQGMAWRLRPLESSDPTSETITVLLGQGSSAPGGAIDAYPSSKMDAEGVIHVAWVEIHWESYNDGESWGRRNLFYMQRTPDGVWRDDAGEALEIPVTPQIARDRCLVLFTEADGLNTNLPVPGVDAEGRPAILFTTGTGSGPECYDFRFACYDQETGSWDLHHVANTDHFFDSGTWRTEPDGTLTAFIETEGTLGAGGGELTYDDIGGHIYRYTSTDGVAWDRAERIDPAEPRMLYHNVHAVDQAHSDAQVIFMEWSEGPSIEAHGVFLWGASGLLGREFEVDQRRIAGQNRYDTAVAIARKGFPQGTAHSLKTPTVVIASGEVYADAMVAAPLSTALGAPILLTRKDSLPVSTGSAIRYLGARHAIIVGGTNTISDSVRDSLSNHGILSTDRIEGRTRYDVAVEVATRLEDLRGTPETVYVASGETYADGLAVGAVAAWRGVPVLLTKGTTVPDATRSKLEAIAPSEVIVVGGPVTIEAETYWELGATERISGANRYDVAVNTANHGLGLGMSARNIVITTGADYPDSLTSSVLAARLRSPVLLVRPDRLTDDGAAHLKKHRADRLDVYVCGGPNSVSEATYDQIAAAASR